MELIQDTIDVFSNPNNINNKFKLIEQNSDFSKYEHIDSFPMGFENPYGKNQAFLYIFEDEINRSIVKESRIIEDYSVFPKNFLIENKKFLLVISIYVSNKV